MTAVQESPSSPASIRLAATVVLLRDGGEGIEVYLQQRNARMAFGAGAHTFPGGSVDERDGSDDVAALMQGVDLGPVMARMGLAADQEERRRCVALHVCAVREVLEESGVLLARPIRGAAVRDGDAAAVRRGVQAGADFAAQMAAVALRPAVEDLTYVAHFVTPPGFPRRFDTRFFLSTMPPGQVATTTSGDESDAGAWFTVASLLTAADRQELTLMPPTRMLCGELSHHADVADVVADLGSREVPAVRIKRPAALQGPVLDHLPTAEELTAMDAFE